MEDQQLFALIAGNVKPAEVKADSSAPAKNASAISAAQAVGKAAGASLTSQLFGKKTSGAAPKTAAAAKKPEQKPAETPKPVPVTLSAADQLLFGDLLRVLGPSMNREQLQTWVKHARGSNSDKSGFTAFVQQVLDDEDPAKLAAKAAEEKKRDAENKKVQANIPSLKTKLSEINWRGHPHPLQLHEKVYHGKYNCDGPCGRSALSGEVYHCEECGYDICMQCWDDSQNPKPKSAFGGGRRNSNPGLGRGAGNPFGSPFARGPPPPPSMGMGRGGNSSSGSGGLFDDDDDDAATPSLTDMLNALQGTAGSQGNRNDLPRDPFS